MGSMQNASGKINEEILKTELKRNIDGLTDNNITGNEKYGWQVKVGNKGYAITTEGEVLEAYWEEVETEGGKELNKIDGTFSGLKIGDYINTSPYTVEGKAFNGKWRVLGIENGQLKLISANFVDFNGSVLYENVPTLELGSENGIDCEVDKLNILCEKYADGVKTERGRSIKIEDIDKITGYNPMEARYNPNDLTLKKPCGAGSTMQYGTNMTYRIKEDGYVYYKWSNNEYERKCSKTRFSLPGKSENINESVVINNTAYNYHPDTLAGNFGPNAVAEGQILPGISSTSPAYDMLFGGESVNVRILSRLNMYSSRWNKWSKMGYFYCGLWKC